MHAHEHVQCIVFSIYFLLCDCDILPIFAQPLPEGVKAHRSCLTEAVTSGRALEAYVQDRGAIRIADFGYARMEEIYDTLEVNYRIVCLCVGVCAHIQCCVLRDWKVHFFTHW